MFRLDRSARPVAPLAALWSAALLAAAMFVLPPTAIGDEPKLPFLPEMVQTEAPPFLVRAEVNHDTRDYREGDTLTVRVLSEIDAYVYVLYQQADGQVFQIFPNNIQPDNRVPAKKVVEIGAGDDLFRWVIGAPFGTEVVKVIASREPLEKLSAKELRAKRFNPVSKALLKDTVEELTAADAKQWTESDVEIHTYAKTQSEPTAAARRFGVFFGVSNYEFNSVVVEATDGKAKLDLPTPDRDAERLNHLMREVGQLKDSRVYTNEQATRKQLEETVTRWLPSVTRPGDTVFIYFSGHGGQIFDDNGDEADGQDEFLLTYDYMDAGILSRLVGKQRSGELNADLSRRVDRLVDVYRSAPGDEQGSAAVVRATGVSDDLFAHWLQRLDGRRVVVVLDTCHAGGFATMEKSFEPAKGFVFDFCTGEAGRLKDIGQPDAALFSACGAQESAMTRGDEFPAKLGPLSVMTSYIIEMLLNTRGPLELDRTNEYCTQAMEKYFTEMNRQRVEAGYEPITPHHPQLLNNCRAPVFLKP